LVRRGEEDPWLQVARGVLRFNEVLKGAGEETIGVATLARDEEKLGLLCLDPGTIVGARIKSFGGFLAMSATLSPFQYYRDLLGLGDCEVAHVTAQDPFPLEHRKVLVAPRISTTHADRASHAQSTAELVQECVEAMPGNVAIFFPSFLMLEDIANRLRLEGCQVLRQRRRMSDEQRSEWLQALQDPDEKTILLGVLGGIFAEGVDLPGGCLTGVFVVGPSLPPIGLELDLVRDFCDERYGDGFRYASLIPGMTRVVQAAGRLIRGPDDRGVVLLIGRRFRWRDYSALLPATWAITVVDEPVTAIREFWESN
jgi:DNA excision repair protein ERCC-2